MFSLQNLRIQSKSLQIERMLGENLGNRVRAPSPFLPQEEGLGEGGPLDTTPVRNGLVSMPYWNQTRPITNWWGGL